MNIDPDQARALALFHLRALAADFAKERMFDARDMARARADALEATRWEEAS